MTIQSQPAYFLYICLVLYVQYIHIILKCLQLTGCMLTVSNVCVAGGGVKMGGPRVSVRERQKSKSDAESVEKLVPEDVCYFEFPISHFFLDLPCSLSLLSFVPSPNMSLLLCYPSPSFLLPHLHTFVSVSPYSSLPQLSCVPLIFLLVYGSYPPAPYHQTPPLHLFFFDLPSPFPRPSFLSSQPFLLSVIQSHLHTPCGSHCQRIP